MDKDTNYIDGPQALTPPPQQQQQEDDGGESAKPHFFEGVEKLLEVWFTRKDGKTRHCDLRLITRFVFLFASFRPVFFYCLLWRRSARIDRRSGRAARRRPRRATPPGGRHFCRCYGARMFIQARTGRKETTVHRRKSVELVRPVQRGRPS